MCLTVDQYANSSALHYSRFCVSLCKVHSGRHLNEIVDYLNLVGIDARSLGFPMERDYLNVVANSLGYTPGKTGAFFLYWLFHIRQKPTMN